MKNIQLIKRSESVNRTYDADGQQKETLNNVNYRIMRDEQEIGTADVWAGNFSINIYGGGTSIEENTAMVEKMFNALNE